MRSIVKTAASIFLGVLLSASASVYAATPEEIIVWGRGIDLLGIAESGSQGVVGYRDLELRPLARTQ